MSFINCNLSNSVFHGCVFYSEVIFKNCLLSNTMFIDVDVYVEFTDSDSSESRTPISFIHSNVERALFSCHLKKKLQSAGII